MIQLSATFETDLVTPRTLATIRRKNNERTGQDIVQYVVPSKFRMSAYSEFPGVVRRRQRKYAQRKLRQVGHQIPNVLSGALRDSFKSGGSGVRITRTANGGNVFLRAYWAGKGRVKSDGTIVRSGMRESQRQELEAVSPKQRDMLARRQAERFVEAVNDPANRRKRRLRTKR